MRGMKVVVLIAVIALAIPLANAADAKHKFSFFAGYMMPTGDLKVSDAIGEDTMEVTFEAKDAATFGFGYEYRYSDMLGFGASLAYAKHDVNGKYVLNGVQQFDGTIGDVSWMPILFDVNFHLLKGGKADLYVGPTVGYAMWDKVKLNSDGQQFPFEDIFDGTELNLDDSFVYGLNVGVDVPFAESWAFSAGLRYLLAGAKPSDGGDTLDVNPIALTVGVGYKF